MRTNEHALTNGRFNLPAPVSHAGHPREPIGGLASAPRATGKSRSNTRATIDTEVLARPNGR